MARIPGTNANEALARAITEGGTGKAARRLVAFLAPARAIDRPVVDLDSWLNRGYVGTVRIVRAKLVAIVATYRSLDDFLNRELPSPPDGGRSAMSREVDQRDFSANKATPQRQQELEARAAVGQAGLLGWALPQFSVERLDPTTGNPAAISFVRQPPAGGLEAPTDLTFIQRALETVQTISPALGLAAGQPAEYAADRHVLQASSGARAVHLQQQYKGLPLFQAATAVIFAPDAALSKVACRSLTVAQDTDPTPGLSVEEGVLQAARFVAVPGADERGLRDQYGQEHEPPQVDVGNFAPRVLARFDSKPERLTLLEPGPFQDLIAASLAWFPLADDSLRLAWQVDLLFPEAIAAFRVLVDAQDGAILFSQQLMQGVRARGNIHTLDGSRERQFVDFPLALNLYGLPVPGDLPPGFPVDWVDNNTSSTVGNAVFAHLGETTRTFPGVQQGGVLTFNPADPLGDDQRILDIFFHNCVMHDLFYLLGFREVDGNFQQVNLIPGGAASDRVDARAYPVPVPMTASMFTPPDGTAPIMKMGLVQPTGRHTAHDATVVYHEFSHGVTNRLVGGPLNVDALTAPQCRGMGEGWGDYIACTLTTFTTIASWVVNNPNGIRRFRYDANFPAQTENFSQLGRGRYTEEHNIGEIWCATLLELNRNVGVARGIQLVVDALKLAPANPSFLDMRDAILAALDFEREAAAQGGGPPGAVDYAALRRGIWQAFAKFGMGPGARSNGPFLTGIIADFTLPAVAPADIQVATPQGAVVAIPDNDPRGVASPLRVDGQGQIGQLAISVDIEHPAVDDLQVSLIAPGGGIAMLHDQVAGPPNLTRTYTSQDTPALAALVGGAAPGDWTLKVADVVKKDTGTLRGWWLAITQGTAAQAIRGEASPALAIPDNDPTGVESRIAIAGQGTAQAIRITVDITHPAPEDLVLQLTAPSGRRAILQDRAPAAQPNLLAPYDSASNQSLATLVGESLQGDWRLRVMDVQRKDSGTLNRWAIEFGSGSAGAGLVGEGAGQAQPVERLAVDLHLEFQTTRSKEDFEIAFRGWLKQYQQTARVVDAFERSWNESRDFLREHGTPGEGLAPGHPARWDQSPYYLNFVAGW